MNDVNQVILRNQLSDFPYLERNLINRTISNQSYLKQPVIEFPTQPLVLVEEQANKHVQTVKKILGEVGKDLTTQELQGISTEIQFLIDTWLDSYEKQLFKGLTLQQLLNERGHL